MKTIIGGDFLTNLDNLRIILGLSMILLHIITDFNLQGMLKELKQKQWWKDNYPDKKYDNDYVMALFLHSLEWSIVVHIPMIIIVAIINGNIAGVGQIIFVQFIFHAVIDHYKCNKLKINLSTDQFLHILQITISIFSFIYMYL